MAAKLYFSTSTRWLDTGRAVYYSTLHMAPDERLYWGPFYKRTREDWPETGLRLATREAAGFARAEPRRKDKWSE